MLRRLTCLLCLNIAAIAAERVHLTITAVSHQSEVRTFTSTMNIPSTSNTSCNGTGMNTGPFSSAQVNCSTSTYGGPMTSTRSVGFVENIVEADGQRYRIACTASWALSNCAPMTDGDQFEAEYDGNNTMWVSARKGGNLGKPIKIKYRVLDRRPEVSAEQAAVVNGEIEHSLKALEERHADFHQYEQAMTRLSEKLPHGTMSMDEYLEALYTLAKAAQK